MKTALTKTPEFYYILPLRDVVVYPGMVLPLFIQRKKSIQALELAMKEHQNILLVAQRKVELDDPEPKDLYSVGTLAAVLQVLRLPDGTIKMLVEGERRASIKEFMTPFGCLAARVEILETEGKEALDHLEKLTKSLLNTFQNYVKSNTKIPPEVVNLLSTVDNLDRVSDIVAAHLPMKLPERQKLLEMTDLPQRIKALISYVEKETNAQHMGKKIHDRVKKQIEQKQREYILHEQMDAIKKELTEVGETSDEIDILMQKIKRSGMPKDIEKKALTELNKLKLMPSMSSEATVYRNYIENLINVPWKKESVINKDLVNAEKILNQEHDGLEKVKERIVEYLAVQNRVGKSKGPILCLVGPPGVGKTSLGKSIAHATGRKFVRMSLGGVRDEAEIRGHRRTYVGALPGKIIYNLSKSKVRNPLFLLDEIDKMSMDFRGDPASALLEVLDPEQNNTFNDHYLEVDYDLSNVMFVTTANTLDIPYPLLDRMEIIHLSGYTEQEKISIAKNHLLKKQLKLSGLKSQELMISDEALRDIIRYYTREAGVRNLERELAKICRKVVKKLGQEKTVKKIILAPSNLEEYLSVQKYRFGRAEEQDQIGQVVGLAWTEMGGELLTIEAAVMPGQNKSIITGQLGEVMQESVQAATTVIRSRAGLFGITPDFFEKHDLHLHVPEGAIPKDGPSAGITMCVALLSAITKIHVHANIAMTGEITLRGEVLPIGGLKEKLLAAKRGGLQKVIIPQENTKDLKEIPQTILQDLQIYPVRWIDEVFKLALLEMPKPLETLVTLYEANQILPTSLLVENEKSQGH